MDKKMYLAPEVELVHIQTEGSLLTESVFPAAFISVEDANYQDNVDWGL